MNCIATYPKGDVRKTNFEKLEIKLKLKGKFKVKKVVWIRRLDFVKKFGSFEENGNKMTCINQLVILEELVKPGY